MIWLEIENERGNKHIININSVMDIVYHEESELTEVVFIRSSYPSVYIKGNKTKEVRKILSSHIANDVIRLGE